MIYKQHILCLLKKNTPIVNIRHGPVCNLANSYFKFLVNSPSISLLLTFLLFFCSFTFFSWHFFGILCIYFYFFPLSHCLLLYESAVGRINSQRNVKSLYRYNSSLHDLCQDIIKCLLRSHYCIYNFFLQLLSYLVFYRFFRIWHVNINSKVKVEYLLSFNSESIQWVRQYSLSTTYRHNYCTKTIEEIPKILKTCFFILVSLEPSQSERPHNEQLKTTTLTGADKLCPNRRLSLSWPGRDDHVRFLKGEFQKGKERKI